jgi:hypothetical protein
LGSFEFLFLFIPTISSHVIVSHRLSLTSNLPSMQSAIRERLELFG